jgi:hypothetical protein
MATGPAVWKVAPVRSNTEIKSWYRFDALVEWRSIEIRFGWRYRLRRLGGTVGWRRSFAAR